MIRNSSLQFANNYSFMATVQSLLYEVLELVKKFNKAKYLTIIMAWHDINQAARYTDNIIVLKDGELKALGPPSEVISEDILNNVFGLNA